MRNKVIDEWKKNTEEEMKRKEKWFVCIAEWIFKVFKERKTFKR